MCDIYYVAIDRSEIHVPTVAVLEDITLSERSQDSPVLYSVSKNCQKKEIHGYSWKQKAPAELTNGQDAVLELNRNDDLSTG